MALRAGYVALDSGKKQMKSFNKDWESKIYSKGLMINNYPYDLVVSLIAKNFFRIPRGERKNIKILDLGCGAGNHAKFIAENGFKVYGIDGSNTVIKYCIKKFKKLGLKGNFIQGDFLNLPYDDNFFDCVLDRESLYANKFEDIKGVIGQVYSKLKTGGVFISFIFNNFHPDIKLGEKVEPNSYNNFKLGSSFYNAGTAHFINLKEIKILFHRFKIENVMRHTLGEVYNQKNVLMQYDEYIIIAKKS